MPEGRDAGAPVQRPGLHGADPAHHRLGAYGRTALACRGRCDLCRSRRQSAPALGPARPGNGGAGADRRRERVPPRPSGASHHGRRRRSSPDHSEGCGGHRHDPGGALARHTVPYTQRGRVSLRRQPFFTDPALRLPPAQWELGFSGVFRLDPQGQVHRATDACAYPNGLACSPEASIQYVALSRLDERGFQEEARGEVCTHRRIRAFAVAPDGSLRHHWVVCARASAAPGVPDGLTVETARRVWCMGSGGLWVIAPSGDVIGIVPRPEVVRHLAFGGSDCRTLSLPPGGSLTTLVVTTPGSGACREDWRGRAGRAALVRARATPYGHTRPGCPCPGMPTLRTRARRDAKTSSQAAGPSAIGVFASSGIRCGPGAHLAPRVRAHAVLEQPDPPGGGHHAEAEACGADPAPSKSHGAP
jgi:hypothetical protein